MSVNTLPSSLNPSHPLLTSSSGFVFNPVSHSTLGSHHGHTQQHLNNSTSQYNVNFNRHQGTSSSSLFNAHQNPDTAPAAGVATRDFSQIVNDSLMPDQISRGAHTQQSGADGPGLNFSSLFPNSSSFLSTRDMKEEQGDVEEENPVPSHLPSTGRFKKRSEPCLLNSLQTFRKW